jgi:hypothetical protein
LPPGIRELIAAVLELAVRDLKVPEHRDRALAWMHRPADGPFSFEWCCDHLGLDAGYVRRRATGGSSAGGNRRG